MIYQYCISEKAMAPHSITLAWKIPWMGEPGGLQSMGSLRVRHNWVASLSLFTFMHWRRKWQPTPVFLPGESQGRTGEPGGLPSMASHRVGPDWSDLAAAAVVYINEASLFFILCFFSSFFRWVSFCFFMLMYLMPHTWTPIAVSLQIVNKTAWDT